MLAALLLVYGLALGFRLGLPAIERTSEARCAEVVDGMLATGDWLVPRQGGEIRLHKPPLYYWSASAAGMAAGGATATTLRLPALLAALALVWLTWRWGCALGGPRLGLTAAVLLAGTESMFALGRRGVAEMELALFSMLALATFDRLAAGGSRRLVPLLALWVALAILAKATAALLLVGLPIAVFLALHRDARPVLTRATGAWLVLGVAAGFAWYAVVLLVVPEGWETVRAELALPLGVAAGPEEITATHYRPPWYYLGMLPVAALPAILLFPTTAGRAWATRLWRDAPRMRFVALAFLSLLVAFSVLPQKQKHYLLPLLPLLCLAMAESVLALHRRARPRLDRLVAVLGWLIVPAGLLLLALLVFVYGAVLERGPVVLVPLIVLGAGSLVACAWTAWRRAPAGFAACSLAGFLGFMALFSGSLEAWRGRLHDGVLFEAGGPDAARWRRAVERHPFLRGPLEADAPLPGEAGGTTDAASGEGRP